MGRFGKLAGVVKGLLARPGNVNPRCRLPFLVEGLECRTLLSLVITEASANADLPVAGVISGTFSDTHLTDNVYQRLTEVESTTGSASKRYSHLEHKWTFNVAAGESITFNVEAHHTANSEGDDFRLAYSTDGVNYTDFLTVTRTSDNNQVQSVAMPSTLSGTVYLRVRDLNRKPGRRVLDSLFIDRMFFRSETTQPIFKDGVAVGTVADTRIVESSGLAASRANPGILWLHNDSGDSARLFALDSAGKTVGTYNIVGATAVDWEDIAVGSGPVEGQNYIYIGDIGNNAFSRTTVTVYRVPEPIVTGTAQSPVTIDLEGADAITLAYQNSAKVNAESLMFDADPVNGGLFIISKQVQTSGITQPTANIYVAPLGEVNANLGTITLQFKGTMQKQWASAADLSPDGTEVLVRFQETNVVNELFYFKLQPGQALWELLMSAGEKVPARASEPNGEAVAWAADGGGYFTLSEGTSQPLYFYERILS